MSIEDQIITTPRDLHVAFAAIQAMKLPIRLSACQHRRRRSDRQNRYYWPCFCKLLMDYMNVQGGSWTLEMAHECFKKMHLEKSFVDQRTGQLFTTVLSTTQLSTSEFNEYLDKCAAALADLGLTVPQPDLYREQKDEFDIDL
jgi:hypothetical protein